VAGAFSRGQGAPLARDVGGLERAHWPERFRESRAPLARDVRGWNARVWPGRFREARAPRARDVRGRNARVWPGRFREARAPRKRYARYVLCFGCQVSAVRLAPPRLADARSAPLAYLRDSRCSGGSDAAPPRTPQQDARNERGVERGNACNEGNRSRDCAPFVTLGSRVSTLVASGFPVGVSGERAARSPEGHEIGGIRERSRASVSESRRSEASSVTLF
jgi:hypothetical protein